MGRPEESLGVHDVVGKLFGFTNLRATCCLSIYAEPFCESPGEAKERKLLGGLQSAICSNW